ncbi:hypothetical protein E2C01_054080 [Portunus trituberculatus]|uniref:Uncharacterized protein n=1 Tax=Portunus trituberculatus TaxID=210409 RepID=A0A5B7GRT4_PORTR|nr:hypothetical protein [Portunus trituberculatus]
MWPLAQQQLVFVIASNLDAPLQVLAMARPSHLARKSLEVTRNNPNLVDEYTCLKLDLQKPATDVYTRRLWAFLSHSTCEMSILVKSYAWQRRQGGAVGFQGRFY